MTSRRLGGDDAGMTLVDLLVSTVLALIVTGLVTDGLISMWRAQRATADDGDARTAAVRTGELLGRDLRSGEAITYPSVSSAMPATPPITVWVDQNFDYARQASELQAWSYDATKKALCRSAAGVSHCFGAPWISGVSFTYGKSADGQRVTSVGVAISYVSKPTTRTEQWSVTLPAVAP
jgi:Tfp pilus assembly protein PilW